MKQRLLLALLMLFSSVGFMKAQGTAPIKIAVPKEGKVTITLTSLAGLNAFLINISSTIFGFYRCDS